MDKEVYVLLVLVLSQSLCSHGNDNKEKVYIERTIGSLKKVVDFYARNIDKVNLDSIFGLRVAEGGITKSLKQFHKVHDPESQLLISRLTSLLKTVKRIATESLPHLNEYQPEYYHNFKFIVEKPWKLFEDFRKLNVNPKSGKLIYNVSYKGNGENFNEKISDRCMTEIMGTAPGQKNPCYVSVDCLKLMTSHKLKRYGNTHQVLYFLLGTECGCRHILEREIKKPPHHWVNVDNFLENKCTQILDEMKAIEPNVVGHGETDLFLEQGLVCGFLGFTDFLSHETLQNMINWQDSEHGCFGTETVHQVQNDEGEKLDPIQDYDANIFVSRMSMRKLLYDRTLANGCSSHETGVATGYLGIYIRWLLFNEHKLN